MSTKTGRQAPQQKQKQKHNQNRAGQTSQQPRSQTQTQTQTQAPKAPQQSAEAMQAARQARIDRQAEAKAAADRRRRMKTLRRNGILAALAIGLIAVFAFLYIREANKPGQAVSIMTNRTHIPSLAVSPVEYSTNPPTSGPHTNNEIPSWKVYSQPITKELAVHGLEDGGVIINYKPDLDKPSVDKLASIATSYHELSDSSRRHVVLAPYEGLSNPIVLTSWGRMDRIDVLDEARIRRFIDEYVGWDHHENKEGQRIN